MGKQTAGLFITGTDTDVGKTYVGAMIARAVRAAGHRVGVYKPVASGCRRQAGGLVSDDALTLWEAAGRPGDLAKVCPQLFEAPLAPHLAARAEGKAVDPALLREGLAAWRDSDVILVEGAGGLLSPLADECCVADLAADFGFPLVVVARNALGTINHTLLTLVAAVTVGDELEIAGIVLNHSRPAPYDPSVASNRQELERLAVPPVLADVAWKADRFDPEVDWFALARRSGIS
ncbi:MAG: dethiobiotin synthase [Pirellulales bacterium]